VVCGEIKADPADNKRTTLDINISGHAEIASKVYGNASAGPFNILDVIYPIGSIYISTVEENPFVKFSFGTWKQIEGRFLLGAGTCKYTKEDKEYTHTYNAGTEGGEAEHTLTIEEMPSHNHRGLQSVGNEQSVDYNDSSGSLVGNTSGLSVGTGWDNIKTRSTGGDQPHNNMPPYLVVYMWERTA
jgi:hypothetical protein